MPRAVADFSGQGGWADCDFSAAVCSYHHYTYIIGLYRLVMSNQRQVFQAGLCDQHTVKWVTV
jgi:hypothetical protein